MNKGEQYMNRDYFDFIPIFNFHEIGMSNNPWTISCEQFEDFLKWTKKRKLQVISMDDVAKFYKKKVFPQNKIAITFDDGRMGVWDYALDLLKDYNIPATIYIVYDWLFQKIRNREEMYSEFAGIKELEKVRDEKNISLGYHTKTHQKLGILNYNEVLYETIDTKKQLEKILDQEINHFSYPYGSYTEQIKKILVESEEYKTISTSQRSWSQDIFALARISVKPYHTLRDYDGFLYLEQWRDI